MEKIIALIAVIVFIGGIVYFFSLSEVDKQEIPDYISGHEREIYEWAKTTEGWELLEQIPCYCGCKFEGHLHTRHCFWKDNGDFDKHGITCSVCFDIAEKSKEMFEQGKDVCEIRQTIDAFYLPNKNLATETPYPEECEPIETDLQSNSENTRPAVPDCTVPGETSSICPTGLLN
jgi:hypothetical protein